MEKIESREKHLNNELSTLIQQYKTVSMEYSQVRNSIKTNESEKMDFEQQLKKVEHNLENIKIQMEQRGNTMSDGSEWLIDFTDPFTDVNFIRSFDQHKKVHREN